MRSVRINSSRPYEMLIGDGLLDRAGELLRPLVRGDRAVIVCGDIVHPLYAGRAEESLASRGFSVYTYVVPHGEGSKDLAHYGALLSFLSRCGVTRDDVVIALGGGVTGDLAGFAAATFARGTIFVQMPTTLLAAVDASIGGKCAIDLPEGKNLAGCFYPPAAVICDTACLSTLPESEMRCGCTEIVKYGVLFDPSLLSSLRGGLVQEQLEDIVSRCAALKAAIVTEDEFDRGRRMLLNLGHSFGHAIEKCCGYELSHGEAVSIGMAMIARAAYRRGLCSAECLGGITETLSSLGLPLRTEIAAEELIKSLALDKKRGGAGMRLVVPEELGRCRILEMSLEEASDWLRDGI